MESLTKNLVSFDAIKALTARAYRGCCMNLASSIYGSPRTGYTSTKEGL